MTYILCGCCLYLYVYVYTVPTYRHIIFIVERCIRSRKSVVVDVVIIIVDVVVVLVHVVDVWLFCYMLLCILLDTYIPL